jgi:hypothetical protein
MKKLRKIPYKEIKFTGVQCPYHRPAYATIEHTECLERWTEEVTKEYKNSPEYKHIEILNEFIEELNNKNT